MNLTLFKKIPSRTMARKTTPSMVSLSYASLISRYTLWREISRALVMCALGLPSCNIFFSSL